MPHTREASGGVKFCNITFDDGPETTLNFVLLKLLGCINYNSGIANESLSGKSCNAKSETSEKMRNVNGGHG